MAKCVNCGSDIKAGRKKCFVCRIAGFGKGKKKFQPTKRATKEIKRTKRFGHPY